MFLRRVHVAVVVRTARRVAPCPLAESQRGVLFSTRRAALARGEEPVDRHHRAPVPPRLVLDLVAHLEPKAASLMERFSPRFAGTLRPDASRVPLALRPTPSAFRSSIAMTWFSYTIRVLTHARAAACAVHSMGL